MMPIQNAIETYINKILQENDDLRAKLEVAVEGLRFMASDAARGFPMNELAKKTLERINNAKD